MGDNSPENTYKRDDSKQFTEDNIRGNSSENYHSSESDSQGQKQDLSDSSEEEVIIEEYETYYLPSDLVLTENQTETENNDFKTENVPENIADGHTCEPAENNINSDNGKSKELSKIKTITRIDEETENVVILIRPRRRSGSPPQEKLNTESISPDSVKKENFHQNRRQTFNQVVGGKGVSIMDKCNLGENKESQIHALSNISLDRDFPNLETSTKLDDLIKDSNKKCDKEHNEHLNSLFPSDKNSMSNGTILTESLLTENSAKHLNEREDNRDPEMKEKYENQGARPKTLSNFLLEENEPKYNLRLKSKSRYRISSEANEKVKKLKEMGTYDDLVRNNNISRNKGVVHDLIQKLNMENTDPEITEEDDFLIWQLMKSLKERSVEDEHKNRQESHQDTTLSTLMPEEKCDWSYEKATLSKDKYLSRRLQTKEVGQVKIMTFMSPSKESKEFKIKPLKVSKTLPFNVKNIFQQKMDELKTKNRVCLTGGKELMFTRINIDNPCFNGQEPMMLEK